MSSFSSGSPYAKRKPVPDSPDSVPSKNSSKATTDLGSYANQVPRAPAKSPLRNSGAGTPTGAVSGSAQTTNLQPVMSTMQISNSLSHLSAADSSSLNSSYEYGLSSSGKKDYGELDINYKATSSSATGFTPVDNTSSPPISPKIKLPSLAIANDLLASSEAMLASVTAPKSPPGTSFLDTTDDMLMQLLISQAIIDSRDFNVLTLEEVEELKKDHSLLTTRISALTSKLSLESKIREAASSLARLHSSNKRLSRQATDHLSQANRKVDQVATELWKLTQRAGEVQRKLLQHMAGILSIGFRKLEEKQNQPAPQNPVNQLWGGGNGIDHLFNEIMGVDSRGSDAALSDKVSNLENSIQNLHQTLAEARMALKRKDKEIEELKQKADDTATESRERTIAELRTELEEVASRLDIVLRKHKAGNRKNSATSENEDSDESDSGGSTYRLSTMTTATQHLQKEQYKNISDNMSALEKALEEYMFHIYKLEQELNSIKSNSDGEPKSQQNELQEALGDLQRAKEESESDKQKIEEMTNELSELRTKVQDLETKIKDVEPKTSGRGVVQNKMNDINMELKLKKLTREHDELVDSLRLVHMKLPDERNPGGSFRKPKFTVELFLSRVKNLGEENREYVEQISSLESRLQSAQKEQVGESSQGDLKAELESTRNELEETKLKLLDLESKAASALSNVETSNAKGSELLKELDKVREELMVAKENIRKYEAILKRQSVVQVVDNGVSIKEEFQQQLAAQEQEYEAQIKERDFTITKLRNDLRGVTTEKENASQMITDLENMLKSKSRTLDQREVTINKLEGEIETHKVKLAELKATTNLVSSRINKFGDDASSDGRDEGLRSQVNETNEEIQRLRSLNENLELQVKKLKESLAEAQKQFSMREESMEKRSEIMQNELDGILREFDRLTKNFIDFDTERQKLQAHIDELQLKCEKLENELADEKIKHLGMDTANSEPTTTVTLRKEFRKMMADLRSDNQKLLHREIDEKKKLEAAVRNLKREREAEKWERVNKGTQTRFVISVGSG
ncbi:15014_t:CDS:2 [Acaulospora colombiana]|uniref:15014_t:CDS:1 n=1 Tax=Acaulospora colombiana TaxID=27376 RepID=A0ACA9K5Q3_9GLOM|nr:15014_t:CDS:2 [Acaulospora colombiana]